MGKCDWRAEEKKAISLAPELPCTRTGLISAASPSLLRLKSE